MPTDLQIAASRGVHPTTEAFAKELYLQGAVVCGTKVPSGAWEFTTHEVREAMREIAQSWIARSLYGGLELADFFTPRRGALGWCYPEMDGVRLR